LSKTLENEYPHHEQGSSYQIFVNAIKSPATKVAYVNSLKRYMNHLKLTEADDLIRLGADKKVIESQLIDYIMSLRQAGISYNTIQHLVVPIFTFYTRNDIFLNRKKVFDYLGEYKRIVRDKAYSTEQIGQALQSADLRMKMIIHILAGSACRVGALPSLTLGNLTKIPDFGLYKIVFYVSTNNEYYSFVTREGAQSINDYLLYRQRCGEKLSFNEKTNRWEPEDTPLIRLSFDMNDSLQASRQIKPITYQGLRMALATHLIRCGLRQPEHPTEHNKRVRKSVSLSKGFRKRAISIFIEAGLNHEIRELLVDHATGLDAAYFRPSEKQVLEEYLKAEPLLTIDSSLRLQQEVETLRVNKSEMEEFRYELEQLKELLFKKG